MKQKLFLFIALLWTTVSFGQDLIISGVFDGPLTGGVPKGVELYVANDIADLALYAVGSANNGGGSDGAEFILSGTASAGDFIYVATETDDFTTFFGFAPDFTSGSMAINGDDAVELFYEATGDFITGIVVVIDLYGDINTLGDGEVWDYTDGWGYRKSGDGPNPIFDDAEWTFSGIDQLEGGGTNATCASPFPIGTYTTGGTSNDLTSTVTAPGTQIAAGTLSSINTDSVPVIQFVITDAASGDGLPTNVTGVYLVGGPNNTFDFENNLAGGGVYDITNGADIPFTGQPTVTASTVYLPITLTIPDGGSVTVEGYVFIDNTNALDGDVFQFQIDAASNGFTATASGSDFEDPFTGGNIVGNDFTVEVIATEIQFTNQPIDVIINTVMAPGPIVGLTDMYGNVDVDYAATEVTILNNGSGTMTQSNPYTTTNGQVSFNDLSFNLIENTNLLASTTVLGSEFSAQFDVTDVPSGTLFISEYIEGSGNNKALEIYNGTGATVDMENYRIAYANNGGDWSLWHTLPTATLNDGEVWVLSTDAADPIVIAQADETFAYPSVVHYNGNDAVALEMTPDGGSTWNIVDLIGDPILDPGTGWEVAGTANGTAEHTITRKYPDVTTGNIDWAASAGTNTTDSEWFVYDQNEFSYIGWHGTPPLVGPEITNIAILPIAPTSSDAVTVSATVTDDGTIDLVTLNWGTTSGSLTNSINMTGVFSLYTTDTQIPAQLVGATVYYTVTATDNDSETTISDEMSYIIPANGGGATCEEALMIIAGTHHTMHTIDYDYDQWYSFIATVNGTATVENCASDVDAFVTIDEGTCGNGIDLQDDECGTSGYSVDLTFDITLGETYYIGLGNYDQATTPEYDWTLTETEVIPPVAIYAIQYTEVAGEGTYPSLLEGQNVTTSGIVSAIGESSNYFIQDADGAWNGIFVYDNVYFPAVGDEITINADVAEYNGNTQLTNVSTFTNNSSGLTPYAPVEITTLAVNDEQYEGVLIKVLDAECTNADAGYGAWEINDGSGAALTDNDLYTYVPVLGTSYNVIGLGYYSYDAYKILPRDINDIEEIIGTDPTLEITSPANSSTITVDNVDVVFEVANFVLGTDGEVEYTIDGGTTSLTTQTSPIAFTSLADAIYTVDLELVDMAGDPLTTPVTASVTFTVDTSNSVEDLNSGISIYPNPSTGVFNVNVKETFNLEVIDITGKVINTKAVSGNSTIQINTQGVYFLKFSNENGSVTQRVIVQ